MPVLPNARHEKFCQELASGKSAHQAYIDAGFRASRQNAARLRTKDTIAARVQEIQKASAVRAEITLEGVLRELDEAIAVAKHKNMPNALVSAAQLRAKLGGLLVDRAEVEITHNFTKQGASPDEILQSFWHACTADCPDVEITDDDREVLDLVLQLLRHLEDSMIARDMRRVVEQDRATRQSMTKLAPAEIEYKRIRSDRERLFNSGLFNEKGRPHG